MDYVVGSIADLISGNVTPNRPKVSKKALTPRKHMPSPDVTPKSEFPEDRSIFLSPSVQKKKAIVKKSPKRIFQNPDLDVTNDNEDMPTPLSPKADKVKKHLKNELEANENLNKSTEAAKHPKKKHSKSAELASPTKMDLNDDLNTSGKENVSVNELTPKKKKKQRSSVSEAIESVTESFNATQNGGIPKKKKKQQSSVSEAIESITESFNATQNGGTPKKKKKKKDSASESIQVEPQICEATNTDVSDLGPKKKKNKKNSAPESIQVELQISEATNTVVSDLSPKKKKKKKNSVQHEIALEPSNNEGTVNNDTETTSSKKKNKKRKSTPEHENQEESKPKKKKIKINPNAVTDKDSDSEHESDNEIESETEENNKEVLEQSAEVADPSSDEEETPEPKKKEKIEKPEEVREVNTAEEIARTLFVGNVPFSKKCKKEVKKIFSKYGDIESVRIRTVPVKDPSVTPKLAVIKQELHPERTTVNVYVKFSNPKCVDEALSENNTVLNAHHLRVSRSGSTGAEHDPRRAVFVGNVPFALEDDGLREKFAKCGEIESVRIVRDKKTNAGKGFAYVNFASKDGVELALALTEEDLTIKNRIMRVKRCTQVTQRQSQKREFKQGRQGMNPGRQGMNPGRQGMNPGRQGMNPGRQGMNQSRQENQGPRFQGKKVSQGNRQRSFQGNQGRNFSQGGNFQKGGFGRQENESGKKEGAYRRINKRKSQEGSEGPPSKMGREDQPAREKKARKEFVGVTAEKKKKHKFDKGMKKKKALSEILTK